MWRVIQQICITLAIACFLIISIQGTVSAADEDLKNLPSLSILLLNSSKPSVEKEPVITLLVSTDTDKVTLAWFPADDYKTPSEDITYDIHFSTQEDFTPSGTTLKKTVTGEHQATINGLNADTTYYVMVEASFPDSTKLNSKFLWITTFTEPVQRTTTPVKIATELGLGFYSTSDGTTYVFTKVGDPTLPQIGDILVAESSNGDITLRLVNSIIDNGTTITIGTSDASLGDAFEDGTVSSVFQLVDLESKKATKTTASSSISKSIASMDADRQTRVEWPDKFLTAEQVEYEYHEEDLDVKAGPDPSSYIMQSSPSALTSEFVATVTPSFQPVLETRANWSGLTLNSAVVTARGTLSLDVLGQYNFNVGGTWDKEFELFSRTWTTTYIVAGVPVLQQVTLSFKVSASATAAAKIQAETKANISRTVELGATYTQAGGWVPYMNETHNESITATLDIGAEATADIRIIPEIRVTYYTVLSGYLSVEPFVRGAIAMGITTNNIYFLATNPERGLHLTKFESALGVECFVGVDLTILWRTFAVLDKTCVLGPPSNATCTANIPELMIFTIPTHAPDIPSSSDTGNTTLRVAVTDGVYNQFDPTSIIWEIYADDPADNASIAASYCSTDTAVIPHVTSCEATLSTNDPGDYVIFVSGHGILGTIARHFNEVAITINQASNVECTYRHWPELELYRAGCTDYDTGIGESWLQERGYVNDIHTSNRVDYTTYVNGALVGTTIWRSIVDTQHMLCYPSIPAGWYVVSISDQHGNSEMIQGLPTAQFPGWYKVNGVNTVCWPDVQSYPYVSCGEYNCPDRAMNIPPLHGFPGDCHVWWDHYDDQGNWVECNP